MIRTVGLDIGHLNASLCILTFEQFPHGSWQVVMKKFPNYIRDYYRRLPAMLPQYLVGMHAWTQGVPAHAMHDLPTRMYN